MASKNNPTSSLNAKNPRSSFYWNDWENDKSLALCSLAAQGLWMRMLCIAVNCEPYGHLVAAGRAMTHDDLSRLTGHPVSELEPLLQELERSGVFSRDRSGRIYSRRLVRDQQRTAVARKTGKMGGNPTLSNSTEKSDTLNPPDKATLNPNTLSYSNIPPTPQRGVFRKFGREKPDGDTQHRLRIEGFYSKGIWFPEWGPEPPPKPPPTDVQP